MINIYCHTNLDLFNEKWPLILPAIPRVGDIIESKTSHGKFKLSLKVVRVTWKCDDDWGKHYPEIELHDRMDRSIKEFFEWYAPLVGKNVSTFI